MVAGEDARRRRIQLADGQTVATRSGPLSAVAEGVGDLDNDAVTVRFVWRRGVSTLGEGSTLDPTLFVRGDVITLHATPNDGRADGVTVVSTPLTIVDAPPRINGATIAPTSIRELSTVSCAPQGFFDDDGDANASTVRWFVNDALVATGPAASTTINGTVFGKGDRLQCELTARTNSPAASGNVVVSAIRTVENTPPVLASATPTVATAKKGDVIDIVTTGADDDDGDALSFEIAWLVGNTERVRGSPVSANLFAKGESVVAVVRAFDGAQRSDAVTTTPVAIQNTAPTLSGARIVLPVGETTATKATTLVAAADGASDVDGDTVTTSFSWRTGGVVVGTGASLPPTAFSRGDVVTLTAVPFDGEESGNEVTSTSLTIGNARPSAPSITVTPAQPTDTDTLRCAVTTGSTDLDNDAVRYAIAWTKNGASTAFSATNQVVGSELTVPDSATAVGETWTCTVTADDQNGGTRAATGSLTIVSSTCSAVSLNGSAQGSVADHPSLSLGGNDFTIEFFFRRTQSQSLEHFIGHDEGPGSFRKWIIVFGPRPSGNVLFFHTNSQISSADFLMETPVLFSNGSWNHIAIERAGSSLLLFVNGRLSRTGQISGDMPDPQAPLTLGQAEGGGFVNGAFSEVRLSRVARYVDDFVPITRFVSDSDTIALYHLDETSGATALDSGPNGLHMTLSGGATRTTSTAMCTRRETATTATFLVANANLRGNARPSSIERVDVHSGSVAAIVTMVSAATSPVIDQPRGLDVDAASRQFFVKQATGAITRGNFDGSGYAPIATSDFNGVGIDVDEASGRLLWSDGAGLLRAALDGSDQQRVIVGGAPVGVFVDEVGGRIFWHDISTQTIRRAFSDGSGQTTVTTGAIEVHGLALDSTTNTLWFADAGANAIKKVNADGGTSVVVTTSTTSPTDLVLDVPHGFVYWTESRANQSVGLLRATLAGTDVVVLTRDLGTAFGLARLPQP
jgi:hypothetical protein